MLFKALLIGFAVVRGSVVVPQASTSDHYFGVADAEPVGKNYTIGGVNTYVSKPPKGQYAKDTAVVVLMDIFGLPKVDNQLLTDHWASAGFQAYAPDYFAGEPFPSDGSVNQTEWFARHGEDVTTPLLLSFLNTLKRNGVTKIAATGYCFGGLYATRLAQNNSVVVSTMAHPSRLTIPDDFEIILAKSAVPVQVNSAELDTGLTPALAGQADAVMVDYNYGYNHTAFAGVGHGFAVSANASDPVAVAAKEGAFQGALWWINLALDS